MENTEEGMDCLGVLSANSLLSVTVAGSVSAFIRVYP